MNDIADLLTLDREQGYSEEGGEATHGWVRTGRVEERTNTARGEGRRGCGDVAQEAGRSGYIRKWRFTDALGHWQAGSAGKESMEAIFLVDHPPTTVHLFGIYL